MALVNQNVPNVDFKYLNVTTNATNSKATILDYKTTYCVGDTITVQVEMYNHMGHKKTYGGDFLRARIFSPNLGAGVSGNIRDFNNGTYNVYFTLFWEGQVKISILLMHPSEGVSTLWKSRNLGYKYIVYTGKFINKGKEVHTECGFTLDTKGEKCEYMDKKYGESFYCVRPPGVACEAFISLKSGKSPYTYLTDVQKELFTRSNFGAEIPKQFENFEVFKCSNFKFFNNHGIGWHKSYFGYDLRNHIYIQWKKHGHPFVTQSFFSMKDHAYITNEIDRLGGGANTIIVISVGQHFRPFPLDLFIRRVLNIRKAIENLFLRSPETKVIIKSENTREMNNDVERFSDFHGYIQYLLVKDIFRGLNVGVVDAWDMTTACGSRVVHPPEIVVKNQINLFLSHIC
ncbi:NXPE family member 2-like isoform X2 [Eleutherodactylus coqui]|uniref:NXPE family member 2-like isoform X2 n=1 Tax=Eleutherodactylus coqui TaxID=57060 RepID=UPI003461886F